MSTAPQGVPKRQEEHMRDSYMTRLHDDVKSMRENFNEIMRLALVPEEELQLTEETQIARDNYEMQIRASNIVRAGESLMKLVADLKEHAILHDFTAINASNLTQDQERMKKAEEIDGSINEVMTQMSKDLIDLELEYYYSRHK